MDTELRITTQDTPAGVIIVLAGQADVTNYRELTDALHGRLPAGVTRLLLDVTSLSHLDSMALRVLVQVARVLRGRGGRLTLIRPQAPVSAMLTLTGADTMMFVQP